jgi:hypothetical protein
MPNKNACPYYAKTGLSALPGEMETMCRSCPLRNERGDCIQDLIDDMGRKIGNEISEAQSEIAAIWRRYEYTKK